MTIYPSREYPAEARMTVRVYVSGYLFAEEDVTAISDDDAFWTFMASAALRAMNELAEAGQGQGAIDEAPPGQLRLFDSIPGDDKSVADV